MRRRPTHAFLLLLAMSSACQLDADLDAEVGPDAGIDDEPDDSDEPDVGMSRAAVTTTKLHLYGHGSYQGTHLERKSYDTNFGNDGFNDAASSLINNTPNFWLLYEHNNYLGRRICMRPDSKVPNLTYVTYVVGTTTHTWNDRISSAKRVGLTRSTCGDNAPAVGTPF